RGPGWHRVAAGETFATIAQRYYGASRCDKTLWWVNRARVAWPERLAAGDLIVIPSVDEKAAMQQGWSRWPPRADSSRASYRTAWRAREAIPHPPMDHRGRPGL